MRPLHDLTSPESAAAAPSCSHRKSLSAPPPSHAAQVFPSSPSSQSQSTSVPSGWSAGSGRSPSACTGGHWRVAKRGRGAYRFDGATGPRRAGGGTACWIGGPAGTTGAGSAPGGAPACAPSAGCTPGCCPHAAHTALPGSQHHHVCVQSSASVGVWAVGARAYGPLAAAATRGSAAGASCELAAGLHRTAQGVSRSARQISDLVKGSTWSAGCLGQMVSQGRAAVRTFALPGPRPGP
jgi:hypothetical protein